MRNLFFFLLIHLMSTAAFAQTLEVQTTAAHIRAQPVKNATITGYLKQGAIVIQDNWLGNYVQVHTLRNDQAGWVYAPPQNWTQTTVQSQHLDQPSIDANKKAPNITEQLKLPHSPSTLTDDNDAPLIHDLKLTMDRTDASVLFRKEPNDKSSFALTLITDNNELPGRVKVKGSFTRNFLKKSLVIKLQDNANWHGMNKFALNAMPTDPSDMREWLSWDLITALGTPTPEVAYVRLYINEQFIGLFLQFEWLTGATFGRQELGSDGDFFHPIDSAFCGDLSASNLDRIEECWFNLSSNINNTSNSFSPLISLVNTLDATPVDDFDKYLENNFDTNSAINWLVSNAVVSNNDTYNKNYFLYRSTIIDKWIVIPWDYDLTFGRNADPVLAFPGNILNDNFYYLHPPNLGLNHPLKDKIFQNKKLMEQFRQRIAHVLGIQHDGSSDKSYGWFAPEQFMKRISILQQTLSSDLQKDFYQPVSMKDIVKHTDALKWYGLMRYRYLRNLLLEPSVFGTTRWIPGKAYPLMMDEYPVSTPLALNSNINVPAGESWITPYDEWLSRPMGLLHFPSTTPDSSRLRFEIETEQIPTELPPGASINSCIHRSWFIDLKSPMSDITVDITLDYLQENSIHHELGQLNQSQKLTLWQLSDKNWQLLTTHDNDYANTLSAEGVRLTGGEVSRFVACINSEH